MTEQGEIEVQENQYRSMAKGTAMMGGVQVFNIFIGILRGKLVALFLGPEGMGVMSMLQFSSQMVQQVSSVGLNLSAVKAVAGCSRENKQRIIAVIRKLLLITSLIGVVFMFALSPFLSQLSFGNTNYYSHYIFLSLWLLFTTLANGELSILQGSQAMRRLAYSSVVGSLTGLMVGVPLYYFFGEDGIVPALIVSSLSLFVFYKYQSFRQFGLIPYNSSSLSKESSLVKKLLSLGIIFMVSILLGTITTFFINYSVRTYGSLEDVGLFQAANSFTNQYAGIVFTAMAMDFFPRLSAVSSNNEEVRELVNNQMEIVLLIVSPIIALVIIFAPLIVRILLTTEFNGVIPVIKIMALGLFFKAITYPMGYISFSKGDKKTFFWMEAVLGNIAHLVFSVIMYRMWGVVGLGIASATVFFLYIFVYLYVTKRLYSYTPNKMVIYLIAPLFIAISMTFVCSHVDNVYVSYVLMALTTIPLSVFCVLQLNRRLDLKEMIYKRLKKSNEYD